MSRSAAVQAGTQREGRRLRPEAVCVPLAAVAVALVVAGPALRGWAAWRRRDDAAYSDLLPTLFDVNTEANVPTWFSTVILLLCALAAGTLALLRRTRQAGARRWAILAVTLGGLSLDEAASLHEQLLGILGGRWLGGTATGALRHAWVVPGALIALVLVVCSVRLARDLPRRPRSLFALALGLYFLGALTIEMASAAVLDRAGDGIGYVIVTSLEEGTEMAGALLLLFTLLGLLDVRSGGDDGVVLALASPA